MNKKLPIEEALEQKLQQIPQPDQEASWQAMKLLLEKEKRRPAFIFRRRNIILLLIMLLSAALLLWKNGDRMSLNKTASDSITEKEQINDSNNTSVKSTDTQDQKNVTGNSQTNTTDNPIQATSAPINSTTVTNNSNNLANITTTGIDDNVLPKVKKRKRTNNARMNANITAAMANDDQLTGDKDKPEDNIYKSKKVRKKSSSKASLVINPPSTADKNKPIADNKNSLANEFNTTSEAGKPTNADLLSADSNSKEAIVLEVIKPKVDAIKKDSLTLKDSVTATAISKPDPGKKKPFIFSAGIGFKQQIPLSEQKISRYGFNGRNNVVNDYIPSVYFRIEKQRKWFALMEFDFAAPRMNAPLVYSQQTSVNYFAEQQKITTIQLRKIFYQKIGFSYHHFIKSSWSAGAGFSWSKLYRSISEKNVIIKNLQNQTQQTNTQVLPAAYTDSFLFKSVPAFTLHTNYEWRRFNLGLRWTSDLQPYIKFIRPSGEIVERKDQLLEFLLYIRLWKSRKN